MMYKLFNVDNSTYIFCVDDLEIIKVNQSEDIEEVLQNIKKEKNISKKIIDTNNADIGFAKPNHINTIGIELANGCNLDCTYCFLSASSKKKKVLTKNKFLEILKFLKDQKKHPITFYFAGAGEPTFNFRLIKQLPLLCKENGFENCFFDLTTNGTILTQEMIDFFKKNKFTINISLDGNEKINNLSRIYPNGKGSFNDVYKNMMLLKENDIEFSCKTVILPNNKNLFEVFSFFEENNIKFVFTIVTNTFDNHFETNIDDLVNFEKQMNLITERYKKLITNNHKIYAEKIINDIKRIHYGEATEIACVGSREGFYIDIEGDIFPCSYHTSSKELSIGNIYKGIDYNKIIENGWYAKHVDNYPDCRDCWLKHLCSGSCFAIKWLENKNTDKPSEYLCKTYRIYWSSIIKLYIQIYSEIISGDNINFIDWKV